MMHAVRRRAFQCYSLAASLSVMCCAVDFCSAQQEGADDGASLRWSPPESSDVAELIAFIDSLIDREPNAQNEKQLIEHQRQVARGIAEASKQAIELEYQPQHAPQLFSYRLQSLAILRRMGDKEAKGRFEKALAAAQKSDVPDVQSIAVKFLVESGMEYWPTITDKEKQQMVDGVLAYLERKPPDANDANTVSVVADFFSEQEETALADRLLKGAIPILREQESPELQEWVSVLEGVRRRVNLPGQKLKLEGQLLDGTQLDWSQYEGKVVLVDFWASDCGPCREELPNVRKLYRAYHEKGFDVVGINLDETKEEAMAAVKQLQIPWATLFSPDESRRAWKDPRAVKYGVTGIPMAILLDQDHRVVHMNARGELLAEQLSKLLGQPIVQLEQSVQGEIKQVTAEEPDKP